ISLDVQLSEISLPLCAQETAWGHGGGLQASRRHLKFSAVVGYSLSPHGTHFWLQSSSVRAFLLSS
ncbi:hypothetical protein KUCAC02_001064, partial [Chaenocephalus aceratus]